MSTRSQCMGVAGRLLLTGLLATICLLAGVGAARSTAQAPKPVVARVGTSSELVARGRYLVEDVAFCGNCHSPRLPNGEPDHSRWLTGTSLFVMPAQPAGDWPMMAPRIAGIPPARDAEMITMLTTGIWTDGKPLRWPMPRFHMTHSDAEAVLAYLKTQ